MDGWSIASFLSESQKTWSQEQRLKQRWHNMRLLDRQFLREKKNKNFQMNPKHVQIWSHSIKIWQSLWRQQEDSIILLLKLRTRIFSKLPPYFPSSNSDVHPEVDSARFQTCALVNTGREIGCAVIARQLSWNPPKSHFFFFCLTLVSLQIITVCILCLSQMYLFFVSFQFLSIDGLSFPTQSLNGF